MFVTNILKDNVLNSIYSSKVRISEPTIISSVSITFLPFFNVVKSLGKILNLSPYDYHQVYCGPILYNNLLYY